MTAALYASGFVNVVTVTLQPKEVRRLTFPNTCK